jgi:hypothetical protein
VAEKHCHTVVYLQIDEFRTDFVQFRIEWICYSKLGWK